MCVWRQTGRQTDRQTDEGELDRKVRESVCVETDRQRQRDRETERERRG